MIEQFVIQSGYLGLFVACLLGATLVPLGSEAFVILTLHLGYNPWWVLFFATTGNYLGAVVNYYVGYKGGEFVLARYISIDADKLEKAQRLYDRWGAPILFFSWVPLIGDPLTVIPGLLKSNFAIFTLWVFSGKALRYAVVIGLYDWVIL